MTLANDDSDEDMTWRSLSPERREKLQDDWDFIQAFVGEIDKRKAEWTDEELASATKQAAVRKRADQFGIDTAAKRLANQQSAAERFAADLARRGTRRTLKEVILDPPKAAEARWSEPSDKGGAVLARCGQVIRLLGAPKAGKTTAMVAMVHSLLTGARLFDYYICKPLAPDQVVVVLDLEQDEADQEAVWKPYFDPRDDDGSDLINRVVWIPLTGVETDLSVEDTRNLVYDETMKQIAHQFPDSVVRIGAVVLDPLFGALKGNFNDDPNLATTAWNDIFVGMLKHRMGAETIIVPVHTSKSGGKFGGDMSSYGSVGWDSKFEALWWLQRHEIEVHEKIDPSKTSLVSAAAEALTGMDEESRDWDKLTPPAGAVAAAARELDKITHKYLHHFGAEPGRAKTGTEHPQYIVMDPVSGRLTVDESMAEVATEARRTSRGGPSMSIGGGSGRKGRTKPGESPYGGGPAKSAVTRDLIVARLKEARGTGESVTFSMLKEELQKRKVEYELEGREVDFTDLGGKISPIIASLEEKGQLSKETVSGVTGKVLRWLPEGD